MVASGTTLTTLFLVLWLLPELDLTNNPAIQERTNWLVPDGARQNLLVAALAGHAHSPVPVVSRHLLLQHGTKVGSDLEPCGRAWRTSIR